MKLTNKQALMLFEIAKGSLRTKDCTGQNIFTYSYEDRLRLINQILNQQSDKLVELNQEISKNQ